MEDKQEQTIEKYGFTVKKRYRTRGAVLLDTGDGPCLLREYERIAAHFEWENHIKEHLAECGMKNTDRVIPNLEGNLVTEWESGEKYVVYQWFLGENCDYHSVHCLREAAKNLAQLHYHLKDFAAQEVVLEDNLVMQYRRYNRELKRVYLFMKEKKRKNEFELYAMSSFAQFYEKAKKALGWLETAAYFKEKGTKTRDLCHGAYNYHNLIATKNGMATTNFEHAGYGVQMMDLAYFFRKVMEKNEWDAKIGEAMLEGYGSVLTLGRKEREFLAVVLSYPLKYRKLMNQYMNGKKTWISDKNMQKLIGVREQENVKTGYLQSLMSF